MCVNTASDANMIYDHKHNWNELNIYGSELFTVLHFHINQSSMDDILLWSETLTAQLHGRLSMHGQQTMRGIITVSGYRDVSRCLQCDMNVIRTYLFLHSAYQMSKQSIGVRNWMYWSASCNVWFDFRTGSCIVCLCTGGSYFSFYQHRVKLLWQNCNIHNLFILCL